MLSEACWLGDGDLLVLINEGVHRRLLWLKGHRAVVSGVPFYSCELSRLPKCEQVIDCLWVIQSFVSFCIEL